MHVAGIRSESGIAPFGRSFSGEAYILNCNPGMQSFLKPNVKQYTMLVASQFTVIIIFSTEDDGHKLGMISFNGK